MLTVSAGSMASRYTFIGNAEVSDMGEDEKTKQASLARDLQLEQLALREHGLLGRGGEPRGNTAYGHELYAFEYELLPPEAKAVLEAISHGEALPHPRDGIVYGNRSGDLPGKGTYREFTVAPSQSEAENAVATTRKKKPNRGRRRLVIRENGMVFFTVCHYEREPGVYGTPEHERLMAQHEPSWRNGFYLVTGMSPGLRMRVAAGIAQIARSGR